MRINLLPLVVITCLLAGCGAGGLALRDPGPAGPPAGATLEGARAMDWGFAGPGTDLGLTPAAVVLLREGHYGRNRRVCEEFIQGPPEGRAAAPAGNDSGIATWMLLLDDDPDMQAIGDCGYVLGRYDYARTEALVSEFDLDGRRGPLFVTIFPGDRGSDGESFLIADASELDEGQIPAFVREWRASMGAVSRTLLEGGSAGAGHPDGLQADPGQSRLCNFAGDAIRFTAPVLVELGKQAFIGYPGVNLIYGFAGRSGLGGAAAGAFMLRRDGAVETLGGGTRTMCMQLRGWIGERILRGGDEGA